MAKAKDKGDHIAQYNPRLPALVQKGRPGPREAGDDEGLDNCVPAYGSRDMEKRRFKRMRLTERDEE